MFSTVVFLFFLFLTYALFLALRKTDARQAHLERRVAETLQDMGPQDSPLAASPSLKDKTQMAGIKVKDIRFWAPMILSIPLTIVCFIVGAGSVGVGHGDARPFVALFPYPTALTVLIEKLGFRDLSLIFILAIVLQYPLYGLVIAVAWLKGKPIWAITVLIALHLSIAGYLIIFD
jgi:hypothetical protein